MATYFVVNKREHLVRVTNSNPGVLPYPQPTKPSLLRVSKRQRLPGLIHALKTALARPSPQPLKAVGLPEPHSYMQRRVPSRRAAAATRTLVLGVKKRTGSYSGFLALSCLNIGVIEYNVRLNPRSGVPRTGDFWDIHMRNTRFFERAPSFAMKSLAYRAPRS